ncbi:MAG: alpha/beta fold hydrolase [Caulobacterales bacterium]|nr:alpha/beta fold hydrolase [Caulobacterales bacterium]
MFPTVLIPGLACTPELFAPQIAALWTRGPVMVASTLSGDTMGEIAAAILAQAPPRFALAGLSMGGYISLEVMRLAPSRVTRLALLDTSARADTPEQSEARRGLIGRARDGDFDGVLAETAPKLLHPDHRDDPILLGVQARMGLAVGPEAYARQQAAIIGRIDSRPHLGDIEVPTLVLVGDQDGVTPPERAEELATAIPGAALEIVRGAGHLSTLEQPDAVNAALSAWLST